jgi:hypothetical protein
MKKLLLITSILGSQLFAGQCTQEQYSPFFDKNSDRYISSYTQTNDHSKAVIDKKSIKYDKKSNKIICWVISQELTEPDFGIVKMKWEFNLQDNTYITLAYSIHDCKGSVIHNSDTVIKKQSIVPGSSNEIVLDDLKNHLNIK